MVGGVAESVVPPGRAAPCSCPATGRARASDRDAVTESQVEVVAFEVARSSCVRISAKRSGPSLRSSAGSTSSVVPSAGPVAGSGWARGSPRRVDSGGRPVAEAAVDGVLGRYQHRGGGRSVGGVRAACVAMSAVGAPRRRWAGQHADAAQAFDRQVGAARQAHAGRARRAPVPTRHPSLKAPSWSAGASAGGVGWRPPRYARRPPPGRARGAGRPCRGPGPDSARSSPATSRTSTSIGPTVPAQGLPCTASGHPRGREPSSMPRTSPTSAGHHGACSTTGTATTGPPTT